MSEIQSKVLIVKPTIAMLGNTRTDEEITEEVHDREHMAKEAGRYVKNLYPPAYLRHIGKIAGEARKWHKTQTICSSFGDMLPTVLFEKYQFRINGFIDQFNSTPRSTWSVSNSGSRCLPRRCPGPVMWWWIISARKS